YQLVLTRAGPMDAVTIEVELAPPLPRDEPFAAKMAADVRHHVKAMVGVTCDVVLQAPGEIPRSQAKAVRVNALRQEVKPRPAFLLGPANAARKRADSAMVGASREASQASGQILPGSEGVLVF